jgi:hypothetical protein
LAYILKTWWPFFTNGTPAMCGQNLGAVILVEEFVGKNNTALSTSKFYIAEF